MIKNIAPFFKPNDCIIALPNDNYPRIYISSQSIAKRWRYSRFYPAFRGTARALRVIYRIKSVFCINKIANNEVTKWSLGDFIQDCLPGANATALLLGSTGPTQKMIAQVWNQKQIIGYVKFSDKPVAICRLKNEHTLLAALPSGVGPKPLKFGPFAHGQALVTTPVYGKLLPARLPPPKNMESLLIGLHQEYTYPVDQHPWVKSLLRENRGIVSNWIEPLSDLSWPVVFHHGDCSPWNIILKSDMTLSAIDWEYGALEGFPFIDLVYYILQVSALIYRWHPLRAYSYALAQLNRFLPLSQAAAVIKLTVFEAYQKAIADGYSHNEPLLRWRKTLWEQAK